MQPSQSEVKENSFLHSTLSFFLPDYDFGAAVIPEMDFRFLLRQESRNHDDRDRDRTSRRGGGTLYNVESRGRNSCLL